MLDSSCVVLNATYEPISVISAKRALVMYLEGKANIVEEHPTYVVHTISSIFPLPLIIALKRLIKARLVFRQPAILTQRNLFIRDKYMCQYCGIPKADLKPHEFLTRDHVIPTARGGSDKWENVVTACNTCNNKKGNRTYDEIKMKLLTTPKVPTIFELWSKLRLKKQQKTE